ncbi:hypothetical protein [Azomonas macrocytogenes]|uniref:Uncharacterized protein n=1 Tax=Azomonas macrocytogenes TaxID=69962 RepID=A0A839T449_AZOMA|nr:hypothetical protein [Azomonas macrocytogenes]MBB3103779.1 hypothetical protein [Azomonas macrocytogenes]
MDEFSVTEVAQGFRAKLWRGERMCLIGMDVDQPEAGLVGFAIEVIGPTAVKLLPTIAETPLPPKRLACHSKS